MRPRSTDGPRSRRERVTRLELSPAEATRRLRALLAAHNAVASRVAIAVETHDVVEALAEVGRGPFRTTDAALTTIALTMLGPADEAGRRVGVEVRVVGDDHGCTVTGRSSAREEPSSRWPWLLALALLAAGFYALSAAFGPLVAFVAVALLGPYATLFTVVLVRAALEDWRRRKYGPACLGTTATLAMWRALKRLPDPSLALLAPAPADERPWVPLDPL